MSIPHKILLFDSLLLTYIPSYLFWSFGRLLMLRGNSIDGRMV